MDTRVAAPLAPRWMSVALLLAAAYNALWGAFVILWPGAMFAWAGLEAPRYPQIWQCVGMIVGVYGVGYAIAALDPLRHWPIVLVGLLGKVLGPIGFAQAVAQGVFPLAFGWTIVTNDLIWWAPFGLILLAAYRARSRAGDEGSDLTPEAAMRAARLSTGETLDEASRGQTLMVLFLRHLGCTFCREALADVRSEQAAIEASGARVVLVHMSDDASGATLFSRYGLGDAARISDPERALYKAFGLARGRLRQLFGPRVFLRAAAATLRGHMVGRPAGDGFQMPGVFLVRDGRIVRALRCEHAGQQPDYAGLACAAPAGAAS